MHRGRWRFFWGRRGTAGKVVLDEGDLFNIPTGLFRGFENVGTEYGIIMALLGGDDAGGGVVWAPQVIEEAREHGLVLAETGRLYDTAKGEHACPKGFGAMPLLTEEELARLFRRRPVEEVVPACVARYRDMAALAAKRPARVLGGEGRAHPRPAGVRGRFRRPRLARTAEPCATPRHEVLMVHRGHWRLAFDGWRDESSPPATPAPCHRGSSAASRRP